MHYSLRSITVNELMPATKNQAQYVQLLNDDKKDTVIAHGPSGTGKTRLFLQVALRKIRDHYSGIPGENFKRLILFVPRAASGENRRPWFEAYDHHFIQILSPADQNNEPNIKIGTAVLDHLLKAKIISVVPIDSLCDTSMEGTLLALDDAQNTTYLQIKTFLSRAGNASRLFILGNLEQTDRKSLQRKFMGVPPTVEINELGAVSINNQGRWVELGFYKDIGQFVRGVEPYTLHRVAPLNGFAQALLLYSASRLVTYTSLMHDDIQRSGVVRELLILGRDLRLAENEITNAIPMGRGMLKVKQNKMRKTKRLKFIPQFLWSPAV